MRRRPVKAPTGYGGGICTPAPSDGSGSRGNKQGSFRRPQRRQSLSPGPALPARAGPPCPPLDRHVLVLVATALLKHDTGRRGFANSLGRWAVKQVKLREAVTLSEQSATTRLQSVPDGQNFTRRDGVSPAAHKLASSLVLPSCRNHRK